MLDNDILYFSSVTVYWLSLEAGEAYTFPSTASNECFGSIYTRGVLIPANAEAWPEIAEHREWRPRDVWGKWNDCGACNGDVALVAGPDGAEWLCPADNGTGAREFVKVDLAGSFTVPAGWDVLFGWVSDSDPPLIGDQQAGTASFMARRDADTLITGTADLLLIR